MKFTDTQIFWLGLLEKRGSAVLKGNDVMLNIPHPPKGPPLTFLHLIVKGAVEVKDGKLVITEYGRRVLGH